MMMNPRAGVEVDGSGEFDIEICTHIATKAFFWSLYYKQLSMNFYPCNFWCKYLIFMLCDLTTFSSFLLNKAESIIGTNY